MFFQNNNELKTQYKLKRNGKLVVSIMSVPYNVTGTQISDSFQIGNFTAVPFCKMIFNNYILVQ